MIQLINKKYYLKVPKNTKKIINHLFHMKKEDFVFEYFQIHPINLTILLTLKGFYYLLKILNTNLLLYYANNKKIETKITNLS